jgi:hypothetical protein
MNFSIITWEMYTKNDLITPTKRKGELETEFIPRISRVLEFQRVYAEFDMFIGNYDINCLQKAVFPPVEVGGGVGEGGGRVKFRPRPFLES